MKSKTIFCDIDGTLILHRGDLSKQITEDPVLLDGVKERLIEWDRKGYTVILVTGRRESCREITVQQLSKLGIFYDQLVMGVGSGPRFLINDSKQDSKQLTAHSVTVERNKGIKNVKI